MCSHLLEETATMPWNAGRVEPGEENQVLSDDVCGVAAYGERSLGGAVGEGSLRSSGRVRCE